MCSCVDAGGHRGQFEKPLDGVERMRAARWHGREDIRVEDVPTPRAGPSELLLRVSWSGICGTDVEEYLHGPLIIPTEVPNGLTGRTAPLVLGHEFVGTVAAAGSGVAQFKFGERVVADGFRALIEKRGQHLKILIGPNL
jgi:(R,R)-butanediol dehydrogenase / meso-butanediol dehydrogenase / diacetyl reductase